MKETLNLIISYSLIEKKNINLGISVWFLLNITQISIFQLNYILLLNLKFLSFKILSHIYIILI